MRMFMFAAGVAFAVLVPFPKMGNDAPAVPCTVAAVATTTTTTTTHEMAEIVLLADGPSDSVNFWVDTNGLLNIELDGVTLTEGATLFIDEVARLTGCAVRDITLVSATTATTTTLPVYAAPASLAPSDTITIVGSSVCVPAPNDLQRIATTLPVSNVHYGKVFANTLTAADLTVTPLTPQQRIARSLERIADALESWGQDITPLVFTDVTSGEAE